jgi:hypothetical protein
MTTERKRKLVSENKRDDLRYYQEKEFRGWGQLVGGFASRQSASLAAAEYLGLTTIIQIKDEW